MDEEEYNQMLRQAIRDRILSEVRKPREVDRVVNNVYGGPLTSDKNQGLGGGVTGEMAPEDLDYLVDITREDLPELNPLTGKPKGWKKTVVRRTQPRGTTPPASDPEKKK
jgi:hypothetical protein